ncbi:hypothetical protein C0Q70_16633 [Pomacea canaliculata]|uniref:FAD-binding PCMH-type domain-containing protein n=1 Tax=Pomacea canaliculata TaxID=400727 RepID=A0A2T7NQB8_POMCA|nr:hypothetical protein C0Q70_16633 [Pomacea canaliculata]
MNKKAKISRVVNDTIRTLVVTETSAKFGANTSLTSLIQQLTSLKDTQPGFQYFGHLVRHLNLVGNVLMRNAASVAGNLMIKHAHPDFPSDVFTMMEAAGGKVEVFDTKDESLKAYTVQDFVMKVNMKGKVLTALEIPAFEPLDHFRSFKITPRSQNAHAYINAGFRFKISQGGKQVLGRPAIVIGGVNNKFIHAEKTEEFLRGKTLKDEIVRDALALMKSEIAPTPDPVLSSVQYRTDLAVNLLYKTLLEFTGNADPRLASGAPNIQRPLSSGLQTYEEKKEEFPLKQALPKKTALLQASGQAEFVNDLPTYKHELCGALVLTTVSNCTLQSVDPSAALAVPGVRHFITARDIPEGGSNNAFAAYKGAFVFPVEEIFVTKKVEYAGQAVGMILADNQLVADEAAKKVIVKYSDIQKPILTIQEAIDANSFHSTFVQPHVVGNPDDELQKSAKTLSGEIKMGTQYHFYMETLAALCVPSEDAMEVYATSQAPDILQCCMSGVLNKPINYINVHSLRLGGGFGGKFAQSNHLANAAAIAAYATGRSSPTLPGKRVAECLERWRPNRKACEDLAQLVRQHAVYRNALPVLTRYKAGFSENGKLNAIVADIYIDGGATSGIVYGLYELQHQLDQGFYVPNWKINPYMAKTNKVPTTYCRGPGPTPAAAIIETILEHVAKEVKQHPILVKELNLYERHQTDLNGMVLTYCTMRDVWQRLKQVAQVEQRMAEVEEFNRGNLWKKKGITMCAAKYGMMTADTGFPCSVSVFAQDGTVTVVQSGVDMGQGLYTKVAQVVAHTLGIPMDMIKIRPCLTHYVPNGAVTGGSTTSERAVNAALRCCNILRERLEPVRAKMPDADWKTLCLNAQKFKVDLSAHATPFNADLPEAAGHFNYHTYCSGVMQTELDVLTGEYAISRVDIMFDCGESLNPMIDIGQIEGGFVMGLGFSLLEDIVLDSNTGRVLNDGTWEYKPPTSKDIPIDWRVHMLPDAPNPVGVRSSKASGEPPTALGVGVLLALKQSMEDAQKDLTGSSSFIPVDIPLTVEKIQQGIGTKVDHMKM